MTYEYVKGQWGSIIAILLLSGYTGKDSRMLNECKKGFMLHWHEKMVGNYDGSE